ncbi:MAG: fibronectin type III domain-containing protein [Pseudomonadota bacterium]
MTSYQAWNWRWLAAAFLIFGSRAAWAAFDETPPSTPPNFTATTASGTQINLAWGTSTDNRGVTGYTITRCQSSTCTTILTTPPSQHSLNNINLTPGTTYTYGIVAFDLAGNQSEGATASATTQDSLAPSQTTNLIAVASSGTQIDLTWTAATDNVGVTGYSIEYCGGTGCSGFSPLGNAAGTSYSAIGLSQGTSYSFRVRAYDAFPNYGAYSNSATAVTPDTSAPSQPTGLSAVVASGTQINLSWAASTDNIGVAGYDVEYCAGSGCSNFTALGGAGSASYSATGLSQATAYSFRVRAYDARPNYSNYSNTASATTQDNAAPTVPTGLSATAASSTQINLNWNAATDNVGVVAYHIERCQGAGCTNFAEMSSTSITSWSDTGLLDATAYRYQIRARDAVPNYSAYSAVAAASTPDGTAPSAPTGFSAPTVSGTQINLSWVASTDNVGVTGYSVERCAGVSCTNFLEVGTPATASYSSTGLTNGTTYRFRMRARDAVPNWSTYSSIVEVATTDTQAPSQPGSLAATVASSTQINLTWTTSTDNVGVIAYSVERCQGAGCTSFVEVGTPVSASFNSTGLIPGTTYRFQVRARDAVPLYSSYSAVVSAVTATDSQAPTVPTGVTASAISPTQINVGWTASTDNVAVTGYVIERCQGTGCASFSQAGTSTTTSFNNTGLTPNTIYRYQIKARDAVPNVSLASAVVAATTPADTQAPSQPTGLTVTSTSTTQVGLSWTASNDNVAVTGYEVQRCQGAGCSPSVAIATPTSTAYNDTGRAPNTVYRYQVRARDGVPNWSAVSSVVTATTPADTQVPSTPANLRSTMTSGTQANLAWDASSDNVGVTGYKVERCQGTGCSPSTQIATPTATTFNDTLLTQYTTYRYQVRANDAAGLNSNYSSIFTITTLDTQAPTQPGNLTLSVNLGQISLSWSASTDNAGVTAYLVERCNTASCTYTQVASVTSLSFADSTVGSATNYSYRVRARDAQGNFSTYSTVGSALSADCD